MGAASCKNSKSPEQNQRTEDANKITIGVFGLNNAGKTSTVKAIEGHPVKDAVPTVDINTTIVPNPKGAPKKKNDKNPEDKVKIIDVSGSKKFREQSWAKYYDEIHGLIYVIDASQRKLLDDNKDTLDELLKNEKLRNKPILILANKQDRRGALNDENDLKEVLGIEKLKATHRIELCTAIPNKNEDDSIRDGFTWLIATIEKHYAELNARVNKAKTSRPAKPVERRKDRSSDDSSDSDDASLPKNRKTSPPRSTNDSDYRSTFNSNKLPSINVNKNKPKRSGRETYSEDDDDAPSSTRFRSRPQIPPLDLDNSYPHRDLSQPNTASTNGLKKKKLTGSTGTSKDFSVKRSTDDEPKSFRTSYENFPDEAPLSSSPRKTARSDDSPLKPYTRPLTGNDSLKRFTSPLVNDLKPYNNSSTSKGANLSDDDDYGLKSKNKFTSSSTNRYDDYGDKKYPSSSTAAKSPLSTKKPTSSIYGDDDDDVIGYKKKPTIKTSKDLDSDEDMKPSSTTRTFSNPSDRLNLNSDYRRTVSKPPSYPSIAESRSKDDDDDKPLSSVSKLPLRSRFDQDDIRPSSSSFNRSRLPTDDNLSSLSKTTNRLKADNNNDRPSSASRPGTFSKNRVDDDDDYTSKFKPKTTLKNSDDDEYPSTRFGTRPKYDKDDTTSSSKPKPRTKFDDDDYSPTLSKPTTRSNYRNDDRSPSPPRSTSLSKKPDDKFSSSTSKPTNRNKFQDDDDDDDQQWNKSKSMTRSNYGDDVGRPSSSTKPTLRGKFGDDDRPTTSSKQTGRSRFEDDDDPPSSVKPKSRSTYDDDDVYPSSSSKPGGRGKYEDDDDLPSKKNTYSSYDNSSGSRGLTRAPNRRDEFDSTKTGYNSPRSASATAHRFSHNQN